MAKVHKLKRALRKYPDRFVYSSGAYRKNDGRWHGSWWGHAYRPVISHSRLADIGPGAKDT